MNKLLWGLGLLLALLLGSPSILNAQAPTTPLQSDSTEFIRIPVDEFQKMISNLTFLLEQDSVQRRTLDLYYDENVLLRNKAVNDSIQIALLNQNIQWSQREIQLWEEQFLKVINPPFWRTKEFYFVLGVITTLLIVNGGG